MIRSSKQLIGLPVRTVSGMDVGQVVEFEIETETGRIKQICVKVAGFVKGLIKEEARIDWSQIVEIRAKEVIVEDGAVKEQAKALAQPVFSGQ